MVHRDRGGQAHPRWGVAHAKLAVPRVPASFVPRTPLRELLDRAVAAPVVRVRAPAGAGKTLLLADWVAQSGGTDKAWVSLDRDDNDVCQFWSLLLTAMCGSKIVPADSRLHDLIPLPERDVLPDVLDALNELPGRLYVVLDDVDQIADPQTVRGIETLLRHQPPDLRLILAGRQDPPLSLARLGLRGDLADIPAARLRFRDAEAADLFAAVGVRLTPDRVRRLVRETDGWAAGLRLAARRLMANSTVESLAEDRATVDYLDDEVFAGLSAGAREFLRDISVCEQVTPELAAELSGRADAGIELDALSWKGSLIFRPGERRPWYRMHPLLRTALLSTLERQRPEVAVRLHRIAAGWLCGHDAPQQALEHADLIGDRELAAGLLRRHAVELLLRGEHGAVRRGLVLAGMKDPWLRLVSALAHVQTGELAAARADLAASAGAGDRSLYALVRSMYAFACGRPCDPRSSGLPAETGDPLRVAWSQSVRGCALLATGQRDQARDVLTAAALLAERHGLDHLVLHCRTAIAATAALAGDYPAMEAAACAAAELAQRRGWWSSPWRAASHVMLGFASLLRLEPAAAQRHAALAGWVAGSEAPPAMRFLTGLIEGAARFDAGQRRSGLRRMREARAGLAERTVLPQLLVLAALVEHQAALTLNADALLREFPAWGRDDLAPETALLAAWSQYARGDAAAAVRSLSSTVDSRPVVGALTDVEIRLLEAGLAIRAGERTRARAALTEALRVAAPMGLIRPFEHADPAVGQLLVEQMGGFGEVEAFAARVHRARCALECGRFAGLLTDRERAVLAALASPRSLEEIAGDLAVSVNTVKTHVRAIYAKLGVNSRRAAVVSARERGLT